VWLSLVAQGLGLAADLPTPFVIGGTPFANVLHMPLAAGAHPLFVQPANADAR
jgi:hypothetical protein